DRARYPVGASVRLTVRLICAVSPGPRSPRPGLLVVLGAHPRVGGVVDLAPLRPVLGPGSRIRLALGPGDLHLDLAQVLEAGGIESPGVEGNADGAAGLALVRAVAEAAVRGDLGNVCERRVEPAAIGQLKRAQAGCVDQQGSIGQRQQLAVAGGVPATTVGFAN